MECNHRWRQIHEVMTVVGGHAPAGWRCTVCKKFVNQSDITPAGLGGTVTREHELIGVDGGKIERSDGTLCSRQIIHEDGRVEIVP